MLQTIRLQFKLYGVLRRQRPIEAEGAAHQPFAVVAPAGANVRDLIRQLAINEALVHAVAVNGETAELDTLLADGDEVRLFPPSAGGEGSAAPAHIFIAGIMQGSRRDQFINTQDYRSRITAALQATIPGVQISDPFALHPNSVEYGQDQVRETFESMTALAGEADLIIAYLPEASMGTAIEMWTAHKANKYVIAVTTLEHNWVVRLTANEVLPDLDSLLKVIENGHIARLLSR